MSQQPQMQGKYKVLYFFLALIVMFFFALSGIMISKHSNGWAVFYLLVALLLAGSGFMMKKRFLPKV